VISDKGALGLRQVMPANYAELRARHRLGVDMFDPRDNILAATAYMRDMRDRFGSPRVSRCLPRGVHALR
jgi:soluble lytic murein transglycosylase-like protein